MLKKFAIMIILMLLLTSSIGSAENLFENNNAIEKNITFFDDDVPTWLVNDYWTFDINKLDFKVIQSETQINSSLTFTDFKLTVASITDSAYNLVISGKVQGSFLYNDSSGLLLGGKFIYSKMSGSLQLRKSDLATISGEIMIKSITLLTQNPLSIPLPIPLTIKVSMVHSSPRPFIDFPLYDEKFGIISGVNPSINLKVESIVLKILNIFIPEVPSDITMNLGTWIPLIPYTVNEESISVIAGTFDAYNVELGLGLIGNLFYSSDVKNIVRLNIDLDVFGQYSLMFFAELIDYNSQ